MKTDRQTDRKMQVNVSFTSTSPSSTLKVSRRVISVGDKFRLSFLVLRAVSDINWKLDNPLSNTVLFQKDLLLLVNSRGIS